jgi:hypothetical protein
MTTIQLTEEQLRLVQDALEMYSRIGIGQFWVIKDHPTFEKMLRRKCTDDGETDYSLYHEIRESADRYLSIGRDTLICDSTLGNHGSFGIFNEKADDSCRVAYDIVQVIRHEFWKRNPNRSENVVMASKMLTTKDSDKIKVELCDYTLRKTF